MGDEDDGFALRLELLQNTEQVIGFSRRQHTGRLVEHQNISAAIQRLEDFNTLLQTDRQFLDQRIRIDIQLVFLFQPLQLGAGLGNAPLQEQCALDTEHDIFKHGEIFNQHEMLMHHADAQPDGRIGIADPDRRAIDADFAIIGLIKPVENGHKRGLASAIFPDNTVNSAFFDAQMNVAIGVNCTKPLINSNKFNRRFCHVPIRC